MRTGRILSGAPTIGQCESWTHGGWGWKSNIYRDAIEALETGFYFNRNLHKLDTNPTLCKTWSQFYACYNLWELVGEWIIIIIIIRIKDIFYQKMSQKGQQNDKKKKKKRETLGDLPQGLALNRLARILCPSNLPSLKWKRDSGAQNHPTNTVTQDFSWEEYPVLDGTLIIMTLLSSEGNSRAWMYKTRSKTQWPSRSPQLLH